MLKVCYQENSMLIARFAVSMFSIGVVALFAGEVAAQTTSTGSGQAYPNKPVRIVTSEPGGNGDFHARLLAQGLTSAWGVSFIVENRAGIIAPETVAHANPDGYTLLAFGSSLWIGPLMQKMPYDPVRDLAPISATSRSPTVLVVHPSVPVRSVKELIALAKAKPGTLNFAAAAVGSPPHLAGELFKAMAQIDMVGIQYKAAGPALNDVIGGQVQLMFASAASVAPHIKSGRLNALAVTSAQPSVLFPGLPTVADSGLPGYESASAQGIWGPAKTPAALIKRLNQEVVQVLNKADVKERFLNIGAEAAPSSPEQLAAAIKSEMTRVGKVIKDAHIKVD
jgi:tripartite-type tricarboxylate transporter receptor subunit TctC